MQPEIICPKDDCVGCGACANICEFDSVKLINDESGFCFPQIDYEKCIGCEKCVHACPNNFKYALDRTSDIKAYACYSKEDDIKESTSGGVFYYFGRKIISEGGVVYGAVWNPDWTVSIARAEDIATLKKMRGSKYVQGKTDISYKNAKRDLLAGKSVLFSGTPCQIAGLYSYLGYDYEGLYTVDVLCRGGITEKAFKGFKAYCENRFGGRLIYYNARKTTKKWDPWFFGSQEVAEFDNGRKYSLNFWNSIYLRNVFLSNNGYKEACYKCRFTAFPRMGDISLGDYAGLGIYKKSALYNKDGISVMTINSKKGNMLFDRYKNGIKYEERDIWESIHYNLNIWKPSKKGIKRDKFLKVLEDNKMEEWMHNVESEKKKKIVEGIKRIIIVIFGKKNILWIMHMKRKVRGIYPANIPSSGTLVFSVDDNKYE